MQLFCVNHEDDRKLNKKHLCCSYVIETENISNLDSFFTTFYQDARQVRSGQVRVHIQSKLIKTQTNSYFFVSLIYVLTTPAENRPSASPHILSFIYFLSFVHNLRLAVPPTAFLCHTLIYLPLCKTHYPRYVSREMLF